MARRSSERLGTRNNAIPTVDGASSTSKGRKGRIRLCVNSLGVQRHFGEEGRRKGKDVGRGYHKVQMEGKTKRYLGGHTLIMNHFYSAEVHLAQYRSEGV